MNKKIGVLVATTLVNATTPLLFVSCQNNEQNTNNIVNKNYTYDDALTEICGNVYTRYNFETKQYEKNHDFARQ